MQFRSLYLQLLQFLWDGAGGTNLLFLPQVRHFKGSSFLFLKSCLLSTSTSKINWQPTPSLFCFQKCFSILYSQVSLNSTPNCISLQHPNINWLLFMHTKMLGVNVLQSPSANSSIIPIYPRCEKKNNRWLWSGSKQHGFDEIWILTGQEACFRSSFSVFIKQQSLFFLLGWKGISRIYVEISPVVQELAARLCNISLCLFCGLPDLFIKMHHYRHQGRHLIFLLCWDQWTVWRKKKQSCLAGETKGQIYS